MADPDILTIANAGYDAPCLPFPLKDLPLQVLARMRSDRVLRRAAPPRQSHTTGRPPRHGGEFIFAKRPPPGAPPDTATVTDTRLNATANTRSWNRLHPKLIHRSWATADGTLPIVEGTVLRLDIDRLPSGATPKPV